MELILGLLLLCVVALIVLFGRSRRSLDEARAGAKLQQDDITYWQETAKRESSLLRQVLANAPDALIVTDTSRRVVHYSHGAELVFEVPRERALGKPFIEVVMDAELDQLLRSCLSSGESAGRSVRLTLSQKMLDATAVPMLEGVEQQYVLVAIRDVTELRKLETARREFVTNISHDLRLPLTTIKAMVETLHDGALSDEVVAGRFLSQIDAEVDNLTQLVRELLELSRIESGQTDLRLASANINEVVEKAVDRMRAQADQKGLEVVVEPHPGGAIVVLDEERIGQVVLNLCHNAIKFTPNGGRITVRVARQPGLSSSVSVTVQDTGVGIPDEALPRIFERFYKVDKARTRGEGTGLGLAIAKHIVQAHGGHIWAESKEGKGTSITFSIPAGQAVQRSA